MRILSPVKKNPTTHPPTSFVARFIAVTHTGNGVLGHPFSVFRCRQNTKPSGVNITSVNTCTKLYVLNLAVQLCSYSLLIQVAHVDILLNEYTRVTSGPARSFSPPTDLFSFSTLADPSAIMNIKICPTLGDRFRSFGFPVMDRYHDLVTDRRSLLYGYPLIVN